MTNDRIWAATPDVDDCRLDALGIGPLCDMCGGAIDGLHIHVETDSPDADDPRRTFGFCSEACVGRWAAGEKVAADRDMVALLARLVGGD